ncbi:MAG: hypothetical protein IH630_07870 [Thermoplasmata archaeon]|nr:hypothetical protein [Thermoplasmata archaeon]TFG70487.1 MAG: hypothetical protein E4H25_01995 [Methanomassiliicoccus sp.]
MSSDSVVARNDKKKKMRKVLTCPQCGSADLYYEAALITGYKYHCKKCNYIGAFVVEKEIEENGFD